MFRRIILAAVLALAALPALAVDLGIGLGVAGSQSNSTGGAASAGGSAALVAGVTGQASGAAAQSQGAAASGFTNNNTFAASTHTYQTTQGGGAFALGAAGSTNQNQALATGGSQGAAAGVFGWIFVGP